jgi:hypothetical protein
MWKAIYVGPRDDEVVAFALGVSPDGSTIYVTGESGLMPFNHDYTTIAYDAHSGAQVWLARFDSHGGGNDVARALGTSPDGSTVYVTGEAGPFGQTDYCTIAYDAEP